MAEHTEQLDSSEPEYPEDMRLFRIAIWSGTLSWLVLVVGVIQVAYELTQHIFLGTISSLGNNPIQISIFAFSMLSNLFPNIFLWFLLQAVKELLFLMIDIKEYLLNKQLRQE